MSGKITALAATPIWYLRGSGTWIRRTLEAAYVEFKRIIGRDIAKVQFGCWRP